MAENKTFEQLIKELEEIVTKLEKGDVSLDASLEEFKKGIELSNSCNKILQEAEKKIVLITESNGNIIEEDFVGEEN